MVAPESVPSYTHSEFGIRQHDQTQSNKLLFDRSMPPFTEILYQLCGLVAITSRASTTTQRQVFLSNSTTTDEQIMFPAPNHSLYHANDGPRSQSNIKYFKPTALYII